MTNKQQKIPNGWKQVESSTILDIRDGTHDSPSKQKVGTPLLTSKNISNGELSFHNYYCISEEDAKQVNKRSRVEKGDILISMIGTVGESALIKKNPNFVIKNVGLFKRDEEKISSKFLINQLHSQKLRRAIKSFINGGIQKFIGLGDLRKLLLLLPSIPEQNRIVEVLETWDSYLEKLDKKIKIKKNIKKGLMQQLLTGKKRLKGFNGKWKKKELGTLVGVVSGGTPDTMNLSYWNGAINWITPSEITKINKYIKGTKKTITQLGVRKSSATIIPSGSLILCSRATIGFCAINTFPITTNQGFKNLTPNKNTLIEYIYYWINQNKKKLLRISSGSTFLEFSKKDVQKISIYIPDIKEQSAIARVLTTTDEEIEVLNTQKEKVEAQKKYLLNNLITGKIRLPEFKN